MLKDSFLRDWASDYHDIERPKLVRMNEYWTVDGTRVRLFKKESTGAPTGLTNANQPRKEMVWAVDPITWV